MANKRVTSYNAVAPHWHAHVMRHQDYDSDLGGWALDPAIEEQGGGVPEDECDELDGRPELEAHGMERRPVLRRRRQVFRQHHLGRNPKCQRHMTLT